MTITNVKWNKQYVPAEESKNVKLSSSGNPSFDLLKGEEYYITNIVKQNDVVKEKQDDGTTVDKAIEYYCFELTNCKDKRHKSLLAVSHVNFKSEDRFVSNLHNDQATWESAADVLEAMKGIPIKYERRFMLRNGIFTKLARQFSVAGRSVGEFDEIKVVATTTMSL